jgi:hypothetical protein
MLTILRKKIQSLNQTQQYIITVILILFNLAIIVSWINFWLGLKKVPLKIEAKPPVSEEKVPQEVIEKMTASPTGKSEKVPEDILKKLSAPKK